MSNFWGDTVDLVQVKFSMSDKDMSELLCVDERSIRNWRTGKILPQKLSQVILLALTGTACDPQMILRLSRCGGFGMVFSYLLENNISGLISKELSDGRV